MDSDKVLALQCQILKSISSMIQVTLPEITCFTLKLKLSQLNYFAVNIVIGANALE